ncbi:unnamed protein product [Rotaria sp. Silwood1]|nr:unnamed protein product [Rotaria sp. Silwood1]CAF4915018.1 unnamed protein product [Rotaria sp. Silwood1]
MFQASLLSNFVNIIYKTKISWEFILFILFILKFSSTYSDSITTLSSSTYHHFEFLSNNSYRNFFLRQYFIDLLNISHSSLIQSMIINHHLTTKVEQTHTFIELFSIDTYLEIDSIRDFYVRNIYDYLLQINNQNLIIETIINNQTCQTSHTYIIISSLKSNQLSSYDLQQTTMCRIKTIQIKFEELGLAYLIIRPKEYTFTYCDDSCTNLTLQQQLQRSSIYALIQSIIGKKFSNIPQRNCVPSQFSNDNFLLRQTDGSMEIYPIKDVIVKQCACL